jgi:hypothetical protein
MAPDSRPTGTGRSWNFALIALNLLVTAGAAIWLISTELKAKAAQSEVAAKSASLAAINAELARIAQPQASASAEGAAKAPGAAASLPQAQPPRTAFRPSPLLSGNPAFARKSVQSDIRRRFSSVFNRAGLTEEQVARIEDKLSSPDESLFQALASEERNYAEDPGKYESRLRVAEEITRESIGSVVGPEAAAKFVDSLRTQSLNHVINSVAIDSFHSSEAFTPKQSELLLQTLQAACGPSANKPRISPSDVNWAAAIEDARKYLSPSQVAAIERAASNYKFESLYTETSGRLPPSQFPKW